MALSFIPKKIAYSSIVILPALMLALSYEPNSNTIREPVKEASAPKAALNPEIIRNKAAESTSRTYKVLIGDTLSRIWRKFSPQDKSSNAAKALQDVGQKLNSFVRAGDEIVLELNSLNQITGVSKELANGDRLVLAEKSGTFRGEVIKPQITVSERTAVATINSTFAEAALGQGLNYDLINEIVDAFSGRIEFRSDIQPGDSFSVIYDESRLPDGRTLLVSNFKAASFKNKGQLMIAVAKADSKGRINYFDADGNALGNYFLRYPLQFTRISSVFTNGRMHPVLKVRRPHMGTDFAAPIGTPVRSVADGTVIHAGYDSANGNMVKIRHNDRYSTAYVHLNRIASGLRRGGKVTRGQNIGTVGKTGLASGPHLHFAFYDNGRYTDPLKVKLPSNVRTKDKAAPEVLMAFKQRLTIAHDSLQVVAENKLQR